MTVGQCNIYFISQQVFEFDEAIKFFASSNFHLIQPETRKIIALDEEGNSYETEYELVRHKVLNSQFFCVKLWLDFASYIVWGFRLEYNAFIQDFHFYPLDDTQIEQASKVLFEFFLSQLYKNSPLGIYIDKFGHTEDYDWDNFFLHEESIVELLPDTLCIKKDRLNCITADISHHTEKMIDDYILITSDVQILLSV